MWRKFVWADLIGPYLGAVSISRLRATCRDMREWLPDAGVHYRGWHPSHLCILESGIRIGDDEVMDFICEKMIQNGCEIVPSSLCQMALQSKKFGWIERWYGQKVFSNFPFLHEAYKRGIVLPFVTNTSLISVSDQSLLILDSGFRVFFEKHYGPLEESQSKKPRLQ